MDRFSKEKRSEIMSKIRSKNTTPEKKVRSLLHALGYRFCLFRKDLPGNPDIVLPKYKHVVFVHGCFWHGHLDGRCKTSSIPKSNTEFWRSKILKNKKRDINSIYNLVKYGWKVTVIWECELKNAEQVCSKLVRRIK